MSHAEASRTSLPPMSRARLSGTRFLWWDWGSVHAPGQEDGVTALFSEPGSRASLHFGNQNADHPSCVATSLLVQEHGRLYPVSYFKKKEILTPN